MQKARRHPDESGLRPLVSARFQVLLTSLVGDLFIIQSPYWFTIGRRGVFSLGGWAPQFHAEFHELDATLVRLGAFVTGYRTVTFSGSPSTDDSPPTTATISAPTTPPRRVVWAVPLSLAATDGIEVSFFSSGY